MYTGNSLPQGVMFMAEVIDSLPQARQRMIVHLANLTQSASDITRIILVRNIRLLRRTPHYEPRVTGRRSPVASEIEGDHLRIHVVRGDGYAAVAIGP
jgi:hypothetical protein